MKDLLLMAGGGVIPLGSACDKFKEVLCWAIMGFSAQGKRQAPDFR